MPQWFRSVARAFGNWFVFWAVYAPLSTVVPFCRFVLNLARYFGGALLTVKVSCLVGGAIGWLVGHPQTGVVLGGLFGLFVLFGCHRLGSGSRVYTADPKHRLWEWRRER